MAGTPSDAVVVATGALLLEMAHVDGALGDDELAVMHDILQRRHGLDAGAAQALLHRSQELLDDIDDFVALAAHLRQAFPPAQRLEIVGLLWDVALADRQVDRFEGHLIHRMAEQLEVDPSAMDVLRQDAEARRLP